jgi:pilus assembly protein CpaF
LVRPRGFGRREPLGRGDLTIIEPAVAAMPAHADTEVKERIREALLQRIDSAAVARMERERLRLEVNRLVSQIVTEQRVELNEREEIALAAELLDDMIGLGPLEPMLRDEGVTDILVNGPERIYVERGGRLELTGQRFRDAMHVRNVAQRIASAVGRRIDEASPMVDARLADGNRVNIVLPPLALDGPTISIRKFSRRSITLDMMAAQRNLSPGMAQLLEIAARIRLNIIISGGTGSGKTTLLNAMSRMIDPRERIISIEDTAELQLQQPHVVRLETRPPNLEGEGEIGQRELLRNALRMRPDRIVLGEVRGAEAFDMLQAMNTGHDGSMSTIHANTPRDALIRLENMLLMGSVSLPMRAIRSQIAGAVDLIIQLERMRDGIRRVMHITEVIGQEGEVITTQDLFLFHDEGQDRDGAVLGRFEANRLRPHFYERARQLGLERMLSQAMGIEP